MTAAAAGGACGSPRPRPRLRLGRAAALVLALCAAAPLAALLAPGLAGLPRGGLLTSAAGHAFHPALCGDALPRGVGGGAAPAVNASAACAEVHDPAFAALRVELPPDGLRLVSADARLARLAAQLEAAAAGGWPLPLARRLAAVMLGAVDPERGALQPPPLAAWHSGSREGWGVLRGALALLAEQAGAGRLVACGWDASLPVGFATRFLFAVTLGGAPALSNVLALLHVLTLLPPGTAYVSLVLRPGADDADALAAGLLQLLAAPLGVPVHLARQPAARAGAAHVRNAALSPFFPRRRPPGSGGAPAAAGAPAARGGRRRALAAAGAATAAAAAAAGLRVGGCPPGRPAPGCFGAAYVVVLDAHVYVCGGDVVRLMEYREDLVCGLELTEFAGSRGGGGGAGGRRRLAGAAAAARRAARRAAARRLAQAAVLGEGPVAAGAAAAAAADAPDVPPEFAMRAIHAVHDAARDVRGALLTYFPPFFRHAASAAAARAGLPLPARCCWGGLAKLRAAPLAAGLRFRAPLPPAECNATETALLCDDLHRGGYGQVVIDPGVRTSAQPPTAVQRARAARPAPARAAAAARPLPAIGAGLTDSHGAMAAGGGRAVRVGAWGGSLLGVAAGRGDARLLVTVQGDGVASFDAGSLAPGNTKALGSSSAVLLAPVVLAGGGYVAALQPAGGGAHGLLVRSPAAAKGPPRPLLDAEQQLALPGALHSLHVLAPAPGAPAGCAAVVLADGAVAAADWDAAALAPAAGGRAAGAAAGRQPRGAAAPALAAACDGRLLAVAAQPAGGGEVSVDVFAPAPAPAAAEADAGAAAAARPRLALVHSAAVACPAPGARLAAASLAGDLLVLQWRDGSVTTYHADLARRGAPAEHVATLPLPPALAAGAAAGGGQAAGGRKRRGGEEPSAAGVLAAALSETHVLLLAHGGGGAPRFEVLDARFGCSLASGELDLGPPAPGAPGGGAAQLLALPRHPSAPAALALGGAVHLLHLQLPRADLAGIVATLGLGGKAGAAPDAPPGGRAVAHRQQLNLLAIAAAVGGAAPGAAAQERAVALHVLPAGGDGGGDADAAAGVGLAAAAEQLAGVLGQAPVPAAELKQRAKQLCDALQHEQELQHAAGGGAPQRHRAAPHARRGKHQAAAGQLPMCAAAVVVSQRLVAQCLDALADAQAWPVLEQLHALQPLQSLAACPGLLPALARGQQFALLRQVLRSAHDVPAEPLVAAMAHLLVQPAGEAGARAREARAIRAAAEAAVAEAAAAQASGHPAARARLALARAAAAAVDGFTPSEVLLHALLAAPVDGVEACAALRALPSAGVLRLLRLLDKWAAKYAALALREGGWAGTGWSDAGLAGQPWDGPAALALLDVPAWPAVLEWGRLLLDAHLARLALLPAAAPLLRRLQLGLRQEAEATSRLVGLRGVVEHMAAGAPLPAGAEAAGSEYTLELLDLRLSR
ncbi:hypothetical protein HT031_000652 [Scenedesmus sp. PABB004]|nr:hypothetical protein HT031_000652 [Scenedesmus sp. PABB004]